jgi:hypothetical protein
MTAQPEPEKNNNTSETKGLLTWKSPSRPFKKRDREYFTTVGAIIFLLAVILLLIKEFLAIGVLLALMFVIYVLETTEPEMVEHTITTTGLVSMGHDYKWDDLSTFWFREKWGILVLTITFRLRPLTRLIILVPEGMREKVKKELNSHLSYQEKPEKNWLDNAAEWLAKKVPLENS